jgi:hypothetical protein
MYGATPMRVVMTLARWLASKAVKAEWKATGRRPEYVEPTEIAAYFTEHRNELLREAWEHPVAQEYRHKERMKLARKAVIAEIRDRGRKVNSIEPAELNKLIQSYMKEHRWEFAIEERIRV